MFTVYITDLARSDIQEAFDWWSDNRSPAQASVWYDRIVSSISTLAEMPNRCPVVTEADLARKGVRQLLFGAGHRATHRILFSIDDATNSVTILRVRHHSQFDV